MRKILTYTHYLLVVIALVGLVSCNRETNDEDYIYELTNFTVYNANNSGESPVPDGDTVPAESYAIGMNLDFTTKSGHYGSIPVNEDVVNDVKITCSDTVNGIPPNQSLNEFFYFSTGSGVGVPIEATTSFYTNMFSSTTNTNHDTFWGESCYLLMMNPPDEPGLYTFYVSVSLSDGRFFSPFIHASIY